MRYNDKRITRRLKEYYSLPSYISEEEITEKLDNSLGAARIRIYYSVRRFIKILKVELLRLFSLRSHD